MIKVAKYGNILIVDDESIVSCYIDADVIGQIFLQSGLPDIKAIIDSYMGEAREKYALEKMNDNR